MTPALEPIFADFIPVPKRRVRSPIRNRIEKLEVVKGDVLEPDNYLTIAVREIPAYYMAAKRANLRLKTHQLGNGTALVWRVALNPNPKKKTIRNNR